MDVTCESCQARYKVDDAKIPPQGVKAKCPKCGNSFVLKKPTVAEDAAIPVSGDAAPSPSAPPPNDPFANPFVGAPPANPFAGGFGGTPDLSGFGAAPAPAVSPSPPPAPADPFGGSFGGAPVPGGAAGDGIGNLFQAKTAFEIKRKNGEQVGPFDMFHIKQMIYEQQLDGSEELLDAAGSWVPITSVEELGEIFRLTGAAAPAADGGGWGASPPAPPPPSAPASGAAPANEPSPEPTARPSAPSRSASPSPPARPIRPEPSNRTDPGQRPVARARTSSAAPSQPLAIDAMGRRSLNERLIMMVESVWTASKTRSARITGTVVLGIVLLAIGGYALRGPLLALVGIDKRLDAQKLVKEGDRTLVSGESGPLLTALSRYQEAVKRFPEGSLGRARAAEAAAYVLYRDPTRLDMKASAEADLSQARTAGPSFPAARAEAALDLARHDLDAAGKALGGAAGMPEAAGDPLLPLLQGEIALEKGDLPGAEAAFQKATGGAAGPQAHVGLAQVRIRASGDFAAARNETDLALRAEPDNGLGRVISTFAATRAGGDPTSARRALQDLASGARFARARAKAEIYLGRLAEEAGQSGAALAHARAAVQLYPSDPEAVAAARRLFPVRFAGKPVEAWLAAISRVRGSSMMEKVVTGEAELAQHDLKDALEELNTAAQGDPQSARAQLALGKLLVQVGGKETERARGNFERAAQLDPDWALPQVALSQWHLAAGHAPEARAAAEKAIASDPTLPAAYQSAAAAALAVRDHKAAEGFLRTATDLAPDDYGAWIDLGDALRRAGQPDQAIPALEKAAALRPDKAEPQIALGEAWESKDLNKASGFYEAASKIDPNNLTVATRAGIVQVKAGKFAEGRRRLEAVVKDHPEIAEAQYQLGVAQRNTSDPDKAIESFKLALKYKLEEVYLADFQLGELYGTVGTTRDPDAARSYLRDALAAKSDYYQAHQLIAQVDLQENQFDDARKELKLVETAGAALKGPEKAIMLEQVMLQEAEIARQQGKKSEAEGTYRRVLKLNARSAPAYAALCDLAKEDDPKEAKALCQKAVASNAAYAPPYRVLGYLVKDRSPCEAVKYWKKFVENASNEDDRKEVQQEIDDAGCDR